MLGIYSLDLPLGTVLQTLVTARHFAKQTHLIEQRLDKEFRKPVQSTFEAVRSYIEEVDRRGHGGICVGVTAM